MSNIIIDKTQYRNFSCKIGRKNKITKVIGNEYIIDAYTSTAYDEGHRTAAPTAFTGSNEYIKTSHKGSNIALFDWNAEYFLRNERKYRTASYQFTVTGRTITNINDMSAAFTLYYNKYENNSALITESNYLNSNYYEIFAQIGVNGNRPSSSYDPQTGTYSEYDETTTTSIPLGYAEARYDNIETGNVIYYTWARDMAIEKDQYCSVSFLRKTKNGANYDYTFRVDFRFCIASGWNQVAVNSFSGNLTHKNHYMKVVKVEINVSGFTVSKEEVKSEEGDGECVLELQTNELMQQSVTSSPSYISFSDTADEIINAYKDDRLIASFDLVNNRKILIDGEERYLRAGDKIKIKGLDGAFVSSQNNDTGIGNDFEIIKANTKYEGFFYRQITAKEILNSNS